MSSLTKYERGDSFKVTVEWKSGSAYIDPLNNASHLTIYNPDGTILLNNISGTRLSTGIYYYYPSTSINADLGIYIVEWHGDFSYGGTFGYLPNYQRECVIIEKVVQS